MTPMAADLDRDGVVEALHQMDLEWADEEDATALVDLLLRRLSPLDVITWIVWPNRGLDDAPPLSLLKDGRSREVFKAAREMVEESP